MLTSVSRRKFVTGCLASAGIAAAAAPPTALAFASVAMSPSALQLALFDTRFPAAVAFSRGMVRRGVALAPFHGDVTAVWFEQLDPRWRRESISVAGMTAPSTLFCLEQLAWDHGLRVAFRGTHDPAPLGGMTHLLEAAADRRQDLMSHFSEDRAWAAQVADHIASISEPAPAFPSRPESRSMSRLLTGASRYDGETKLVSWLIAPKAGGHSLRSVWPPRECAADRNSGTDITLRRTNLLSRQTFVCRDPSAPTTIRCEPGSAPLDSCWQGGTART